MARLRHTVSLIGLFLFVSPVSAQGDASGMTFSQEWSGGNDENSVWIQASGRITGNTAEEFAAFVTEHSCGSRVVLDSPGGNLIGGLRLGEAIRRAGCTTAIGTTHRIPGELYAVIRNGACMSACVYAFMGGTHREVDPGDAVGVHQHYQNSALDSSAAKLFSGLDLSVLQVLDGMLIAYASEMGVDPLAVALGSAIPPGQPILVLEHEMLAELNLATNLWTPAPWTLVPSAAYLSAKLIQPQQDQSISVSVEFFCEDVEDVTNAGLVFNIPIEERVRLLVDQLIETRPSVELKYGKEKRTGSGNYSYFHQGSVTARNDEPIYSIRSWPDGTDTLSVIVLLSAKDIQALVSHRSVWLSPEANYLNHFLSHEFSLDQFDVVAPYVLQHCIR